MSMSIGSNEARGTWSTIISTLQNDLEEIHSLSTTIHDETTFRDKFLALPEERHERDPDANYAFFIRYHEQILFFIREIDNAVVLEPPGSLNDVFWTVAYVAIEEFNFDDFEDVYEDLNSGLPKDTSNLAQFPRNTHVQQPLQTIFEAYIRCYLELIRQVKTEEDEIDFGPVEAQISQAKDIYEEQQGEWKRRCEIVKQEVEDILHQESGGDENYDTRFEHIRDLGKGSYGKVDEVRESRTSSVYARKSIPRRVMGQEAKSIEERVKNEAEIMSKLRHNHIASVNMLFCNDHFWSIIMLPVADGDLRGFLEDKCIGAGYPADAVRQIDAWFGCLISALTYAHDEQVKHEDIKPNNILIKGRKIYLTDFGTAKDFSELEASTVHGYMEQGTPVYWAPEPRAWGRPADVFALGCVFAEMLTVRQRKSLKEFRKFRFNSGKEFGYAYRSNLPRVKRWLKDFLGITSRDPVAQTILEQTLNMMIEDHLSRPDARRIRKQLKTEEQLFCASCW